MSAFSSGFIDAALGVFHGLAGRVRNLSTNAEIALTKDSPMIQFIVPTGAIDLLLPPEADSVGRIFIIANKAGSALAITVKEDSDTTTIASIAQNGCALFVCDGVVWESILSA